MRNLKRALSLTLASVMLLGMMVVGSSAAAGYDDVDVNDNVEAIEVLQAVEVMVGDDRGFGPDRPVTRNEMAVVMGKLLNLDYNYYSETCPFTDVASWAKGWVGAAAANGIVSGRGNGIYDGEATVTAVEAASMMMRALGYFKYQNDYADGFQVSTVRQGTKIGIFDQVGTDASTPMTRNQVAQMALNALKTGMVEPDGNTINLTTPDGTVFTGKVNYVYVTSNKPFATAISSTRASSMGSSNDSPIVELGEQLYDGKLKLFDGASDDFLRPSRRWEYDGKVIGTYMKKELIRAEWTVEVTGKDFYDLLGADTIKDYSFDIAIDGVAIDAKTGSTDHNNDVFGKDGSGAPNSGNPYFDENMMTKSWKTGVGQTGKGVLTQVFVNPDTKEVDIAVINTYLAKAAADYNEKRDELKLDVYGVEKTGSGNSTVWYKEAVDCSDKDSESRAFTVTNEDFNVADVKKDDIMMVTQANGEIITIAEPEVLSAATLTAFSKDKYVINDGTQYDYNTTIEYDPDTLDNYTGDGADQQLKDTEYNLYLDAYGYLIGVEIVEAQKNYIFLTGIDQGTSNLSNKVSDAAGILLDGTFLNFRVNMTDSRLADGTTRFTGHPLWNTWCTYTVDKDGTYTLKEVKVGSLTGVKAAQWHDLVGDTSSGKKLTIDTKRVALKASAGTFAYGNDDSVYIVPETMRVAARDKVLTGFTMMGDNATHVSLAADIDEGDPVIIISGVESRGTGIDQVSIETWNKTDVFNNTDNSAGAEGWPGSVYTLYDDDNYIIGAVVLGEDTGASKNWVYVNSDSVKYESYDATEDEWTWVREVIHNGVATDLTEKGSGLSILKTMGQHAWYEVTYKANDTVKAVNLAYFSERDANLIGGTANPAGNGHVLAITDGSGTGASFTDNVNHLEYMNVNGKDTYLYEEVWGLGADDNGVSTGAVPSYAKTTVKTAMGKQPTLVGGTLYVDTANKKGVYVSTDVKSVLIQTNDGKETTTYGENRDDLKEMLDDLNLDDKDTAATADDTYLFKISAIVEKGRATTVIIHDWNETDVAGGDKDRNPGEELTGNINVYVSFRTDATDETTEVEEVVIPMDRQADGRLVLKTANAEAGKDTTDWDDYYTIVSGKGSLNKALTVAEGTSFAEAVVEVKRITRNVTLPVGWTATWPADGDYIPAGNFTSANGTGNNVVAIPTGAVVTITPVNTDVPNAFTFLYNPLVAADKQMAKGADGAAVATAWGTFTVTDDAAANTTLTNNQYAKLAFGNVTAADGAAIPCGAGETYENANFTAALAANDNVALLVDGDYYVKSGDAIKVTITCDVAAVAGTTQTGGAVNTTVTVNGSSLTATKSVIAADTALDADHPVTVTVTFAGNTGTADTATIEIPLAD